MKIIRLVNTLLYICLRCVSSEMRFEKIACYNLVNILLFDAFQTEFDLITQVTYKFIICSRFYQQLKYF